MIIALIGKTGSGKSETVKYFEQHLGFERIVPYTTRPMRAGEKDGREYHFITEDEFRKMIISQQLAEYKEYNAVFGHS